MSPLQLAQEYMFGLWSDADHVAKLADDARRALANGRPERALEYLADSRRTAERIEMRLNDAVRYIERAALRASPQGSTKEGGPPPPGGPQGGGGDGG